MTTTNQHNKSSSCISRYTPPVELPPGQPVFRGEWDSEGVYIYQAYRDEIADWALEHQKFGGPAWNPTRMTWIKPSFAWMLYRSGYGCKPGQPRILKIKLAHADIAHLLSHCKLINTNKEATKKGKTNPEVGGNGRIQWDPERDLFQTDDGRGDRVQPRRMLRTRAIQIGLAEILSEYYVDHIISIEDVTNLAHKVAKAHRLNGDKATHAAMEDLRTELPNEQPYLPLLPLETLRNLALLPGPAADEVAQLGRGSG
jgi:hypothetical protein